MKIVGLAAMYVQRVNYALEESVMILVLQAKDIVMVTVQTFSEMTIIAAGAAIDVLQVGYALGGHVPAPQANQTVMVNVLTFSQVLTIAAGAATSVGLVMYAIRVIALP